MSHQDDVFLKTFIGVMIGLAVFTVVIVILANSVGQLEQTSVAGKTSIEEQLAPVGRVRIAGETAPATATSSQAAPAAPRSGKDVVAAACAACHATGAAGAPKLGDGDAWGPRVAQGVDTLVDHAIHGFKGMPAKGGNPTVSDEEVRRAVAYMVDEVGGAAPPAAAPASAAQASAAPAVNGEETYKTVCAVCHAAGVAGAPKLGDAQAWGPRIANGLDALKHSAIQGKGAMPPKGGRVDLSDAAIGAAVEYMAAQVQ